MGQRICLLVSAQSDLSYVDADVRRLHPLLTDPQIGGCLPSEPILGCESARAFENALFDVLEDWDRENQLILYFAGHGLKKDGHYNLLFGLGKSSTTAFDVVRIKLQVAGVSKAILILDACYSGETTRSGARSQGLRMETMEGMG